MVIMAMSMTAMVAVAAMVIDGGHLYVTRRQVQNAADAAALAGARMLDRYQRSLVTDPTAIVHAVSSAATVNGASAVSCALVDFNRTALGACPTAAGDVVPAAAAGVTVTTTAVQANGFANYLRMPTFTANASATAEFGRPGGGVAPFMLCASDPQDQGAPILSGSGGAYTVNSAAIGKTYRVWGNDIKQYDCGDGSNSFRGLVDQSNGPMSIPGVWPSSTGNKTGPTVALIDSGNQCDATYATGCLVVLPLCPYAAANGMGGSKFALYCTDFGLFAVLSVDAPRNIKATFLGAAVVVNTTGGISGPADPNGARVIELTG